jgi:signal transduction histidine kinase
MQLTTLINLITHELRNPLASIQTQADLIARTSTDSSAVRLAVKIMTASQRAAQVISQWIEHDDAIPANPISAPAESLDLPQLVDQVAQELRACYVGFQVDFAKHRALQTRHRLRRPSGADYGLRVDRGSRRQYAHRVTAVGWVQAGPPGTGRFGWLRCDLTKS